MFYDGEIMSYINKIPFEAKREELAKIISQMGDTCDMGKTMAPGVRQKKLSALLIDLSRIIKEFESRTPELEDAAIAAANAAKKAANNKRKANENAAATKEAANENLRKTQAAAFENSQFINNLKKLKSNMNSLSGRLNKAISNTRNSTRTNAATSTAASAARKGGRRPHKTRKARRA